MFPWCFAKMSLKCQGNLHQSCSLRTHLAHQKVKQILSTPVADRPSMHLPENNFQRIILILEASFSSLNDGAQALCVAQLMDKEEVDGSECVSKKCLNEMPHVGLCISN